MAKTGATLKTPATPGGILDLEFAYNVPKATTVINAWTDLTPVDNKLAAIVNTRLDFVFLFFYALFFNYTCKLIAANFSGSFHAVGNILAKCALVAGIFDILENFGMLLTLHGHITDMCTLLTFIFSISKWLLVIAALLYILIAGTLVLYRKMNIHGLANLYI